MKLKEVLSKISLNKKNGQLTTYIRKSKLKESGLSKEELFNLDIDFNLKKLLYED